MPLGFKPGQIQIAWFLNGLGPIDRLEFAKRLVEASQNSLDGDPAIIPLPDEVPNEAPLIILRSKDDTMQMNVAQTRVDFFARAAAIRAQDYRLTLPLEKLIALVSVLRSGSLILRQAIASFWIAEPNEGGTEYITRNYLQQDPLARTALSAEVHFLHKIDIVNIPSNRWTRLRSLVQTDSKLNYLTLLVDINSAAERSQSFDQRMVSDFLTAAVEHTRDVIVGLKQ